MKISLQKLSTKNLATLSQRVINSSKSGSFPMVQAHPLLIALENTFSEYDLVYAKLVYSGKGIAVATADKERDIAFRNLKSFLNGYRKLPSAPNQPLADELFRVFKNYGLNIDELSYSEETAQLSKLIEELEKSENLQKISTLSLVIAFEDLKTKHHSFENVFAQQAEANGALRSMKSATSLRKLVEKALKSYLNLVTAMDGVELWKQLYADLNELVKAAKNSSENYTSKKDNSEKKEQ